jgi:hypothetical protein
MWVISKDGLFNLDNVLHVRDFPGGTVADCNGSRLLIADQNICDKIATALKNGENFLEVE